MSKVALIIIYNHQYNENIEVLEKVYKNKFSDVYHLIPFYTGQKSNVIPVYCRSYYFQGYIAQALNRFYKKEYDHYFFVADDMILNPKINENNYTEYLNLDENSSFLPELISLHETKEVWPWTKNAVNYQSNIPGVEAKKHIPNYKSALERFGKYNLKIKPLKYEQIWNRFAKDEILLKKEYNLSYPLVSSYSDIFVISASTIKQFSHYCGVFAATELFVELALPTALVLSADKIIQEKDIKLQGKALWTEEDYQILGIYEGKLDNLLNSFPEGFLYLHPIKLSRWNTNSIQDKISNINSIQVS